MQFGIAIRVLNCTTAERDLITPANGMIIYNTTTAQFERYQNGAWGAFGNGSTSTATINIGLMVQGSYFQLQSNIRIRINSMLDYVIG